jgi:putative holliday junction resolvase
VGRLICLDYGRKRVGIATTDPLQIIASAVETVATHDIRTYVKDYLVREEIDEVVVGYPKTLKNEPSEAVQYIDPFLKWFRMEFPDVPLVLYDERFTSKMAEDTLIRAGVPKQARRNKSLVDKISASLILQSYLESEQNRKDRIVK